MGTRIMVLSDTTPYDAEGGSVSFAGGFENDVLYYDAGEANTWMHHQHGAGTYGGGGGGTVVVSGGTVDLVKAGTVTTNNDKTGYTVSGGTVAIVAGGTTVSSNFTAAPTLAAIAGTITNDHGTGSYGAMGNGGTCVLTYTVYKPDASLAPNAIVYLYSDSGRASLITTQTTNISGVVTFNGLLAQTYYLRSQLPPYPDMLDSEVVT